MTQPAREQIASLIDPEIWAIDLPIPTRGNTIDFHARRQASIAKADAILSLLPAVDGWSDIASVPKDDTWVLCWGPDCGHGVAKFQPNPIWEVYPEYTHWMALPASPDALRPSAPSSVAGSGTDNLVTLADCPPGLFRFNDVLGFKTEYGAMRAVPPFDVPGDQLRWNVSHWPDAYVVASGEYFWGGTDKHPDRAKLMVEPVEEVLAAPASDGLRSALELARPIVEADLHEAIDHADGDWEGMSRTALEAIDAALGDQPQSGGNR